MMGWLKRAFTARLPAEPVEPVRVDTPSAASLPQPAAADVAALFAEGCARLRAGDNAKAADCFQQALRVDPRNAAAHNNLGVVLCKAGRYQEAETHYRQALGITDAFPDALFNFGALLHLRGEFADAEIPLRRGLTLQPTSIRFQSILGINLLNTGRIHESRDLIEKVLHAEPANTNALLALGQLAVREGRFAEAETRFKRTLEVNPNAHGAWTGLAGMRRMTSADGAWLRGAEACASSGIGPLGEADVRYAIGKYYDDIGCFEQAFRSCQRAAELSRMGAPPYDRDERSRFVDDIIRAYTPGVLSQARPGASDSKLPVLVTGMPRSGTSLVEQIIASHPDAKGAGELLFWGRNFMEAESLLRHSPPGEPLTESLAQGYLQLLREEAPNAHRVVDKRPFNADFLGIVHCVFPHARVVYLRRDPIDTCLSCFFQAFPPALNFTKDLFDLAHYYGEHRRLMEYWRSALPPGTLLDVPYAELVADQQGWTRRILDFVGLPFDERCLSFQSTDRTVLTASSWQVRQKLYKSSVGRWRNYEKHLGPLLELRGLD